MSQPEEPLEVLLVFYNISIIHIIHIHSSVSHVMHPESCIPLVSLTASASTKYCNVCLFMVGTVTGSWGRRIRGNRIDYNPAARRFVPGFWIRSKSEIQCLPPRIH